MKTLKTIIGLVLLLLFASCGGAQLQQANKLGNLEGAEEIENGRSELNAEIMEPKPEFFMGKNDDGQIKVGLKGFEFNMETSSIDGEAKVFYIDSPELVSFAFWREIEGVMYSVFKMGHTLLAVPQ